MFTWISKLGLVLSIALLAGCEEATGLPFAADRGSAAQSENSRSRTAHVKLAGGAIILAAPDGYCIDRRSVKYSRSAGFAIMARCDTLGVRGFFGSYDLAIITITTQPHLNGERVPSPSQVARSAGTFKVLAQSKGDDFSLVRLSGGPSRMEGVSDVHWRGAFVVNEQLIGVGLYAPKGSPVLRANGATVLREMAFRTRQASKQVNVKTSAANKAARD